MAIDHGNKRQKTEFGFVLRRRAVQSLLKLPQIRQHLPPTRVLPIAGLTCISSAFSSLCHRQYLPLCVTFPRPSSNLTSQINVSKYGNLPYLCGKHFLLQYFQTRFLEEADKFIAGLDPKAARKVFYNIDLAEQSNDPKLFKKLQKDIWEFRTKFGGVQIRLLAFWDKDKETETLVFATHGFIKKVDKVPANEIERAINIRKKYFESKHKK